jgi:hypothetical protein
LPTPVCVDFKSVVSTVSTTPAGETRLPQVQQH